MKDKEKHSHHDDPHHDHHDDHEHDHKKKKKRRKSGGLVLFLLLLLIILLALIWFFRNGFGLGKGSGGDSGSGGSSSVTDDTGSDTSTEFNSDVTVIRVEWDKIYFGTELCADIEDLKNKIMDAGEGKKYKLESNATEEIDAEVRNVLTELKETHKLEIDFG